MNSMVEPKHKVGDFVSWVCNSRGKVHCGKVVFAVAGFAYDCPHYGVSAECCDEEKTMYIDEDDVLQGKEWNGKSIRRMNDELNRRTTFDCAERLNPLGGIRDKN